MQKTVEIVNLFTESDALPANNGLRKQVPGPRNGHGDQDQKSTQGVPETMTIVQKCATGFAAVLLSSAALLDAASADPSMVATAGSVQHFDHSQIKEVAPSNTIDLSY